MPVRKTEPARDAPRARGWWRRGASIGARYLLLVVVAVVVLFPVWTAVMVATKPLTELGSLDLLVPRSVGGASFGDAFADARLGRYLVNSAVVSLGIMVLQVLTSVLAAYVFAYVPFRGRSAVFALFLATLMIPTEVAMVVNLETVQTLDWTDTYQALIVPFAAFAFGTFLVRQAFLGIPTELREAAAVDGYGHWGFLRRVAVPMARPSVSALAVFSFLLAWNQYLWPLLVTNDPDLRTVQIGLKSLAFENPTGLNLVMAGTLLAALPILVVLIVFERQLVRGLTAGAVKG
ncbi:MAG: carbohydrate ABC transporter permease [Acidimicrobiales bacterium]|nr:carbohydrate ABC transporter permease [Acidimicrobiales bacterium]